MNASTGEQRSDVALHVSVAFAATPLELLSVRDLHVATPARERARGLKASRRQCDCGASHPKRLRYAALRQRNPVTIAAIVDLKQQSADTGLHRVGRVAERGLLRLSHHGAIETRRETPDGGA